MCVYFCGINKCTFIITYEKMDVSIAFLMFYGFSGEVRPILSDNWYDWKKRGNTLIATLFSAWKQKIHKKSQRYRI